MDLDLSLVIPARNEAARLKEGYARLKPSLERYARDRVEIVLVDDGSDDDTLEVARDVFHDVEHALLVRQPRHFGKGAALRVGLRLARGAHVVTLDADASIDPRHLVDIATALERSDVAPGTRALAGAIHYDSSWRTFAGSAFNRLVRHYTATTLRDTQCGCKGFRLGPGRLLALLSTVDGFAFDVEILTLASALGLTVEAVAVTWRDVPGSSVRPLRAARHVLRDVRALRSTHYENPVVALEVDCDVVSIASAALGARVNGLVLARGSNDALVVLGRDDAVAALGIAQSLGGQLRTATLEDLRGRSFEAI